MIEQIFARTFHIRRDHRHARAHCLENREPESLLARRRHEQIHLAERRINIRAIAGQMNPRIPLRQPLQLRALRPFAENHQRRPLRRRRPKRPHQYVHALARMQPPDCADQKIIRPQIELLAQPRHAFHPRRRRQPVWNRLRRSAKIPQPAALRAIHTDQSTQTRMLVRLVTDMQRRDRPPPRRQLAERLARAAQMAVAHVRRQPRHQPPQKKTSQPRQPAAVKHHPRRQQRRDRRPGRTRHMHVVSERRLPVRQIHAIPLGTGDAGRKNDVENSKARGHTPTINESPRRVCRTVGNSLVGNRPTSSPPARLQFANTRHV